MSVNPLTPRMQRMPAFSGVAASQTASLQLPVGGPTYHGLFLNYVVNGVAATAAQINALRGRLKLNGTTFYEIYGDIERSLNAFYGHAHVDGSLPILLARPTARTPKQDLLTAIGTADPRVSQLTLEIDIPAVTNPVLTCEAEVSDIRRPVNSIIRRQIFPNETLQSGVNQLNKFPRNNGDMIGFHINSTVVTGLDMDLNGRSIVQGTPATQMHRQLLIAGGRTVQSNFIHFDPCARDDYNSRIPLSTPEGDDFRVMPTTSGAGTGTFVMDTLYAPFPLMPEPAGIN